MKTIAQLEYAIYCYKVLFIASLIGEVILGAIVCLKW